jgi:hypothetical protein
VIKRGRRMRGILVRGEKGVKRSVNCGRWWQWTRKSGGGA